MNNYVTDPSLVRDVSYLTDATEGLLQLIDELAGIARQGKTKVELPQDGPIKVLVANSAVIAMRNRIRAIELDRGSM